MSSPTSNRPIAPIFKRKVMEVRSKRGRDTDPSRCGGIRRSTRPASRRGSDRAALRPYSHADVEIVTYVRAGVVSHKDSLGNEGRIETGDLQVISAGNGIQHAEHNPGDVPTKIFQLWLRPRVGGDAPRWGMQSFPKSDRAGHFITLASGRGTKGSLELRCDAEVLGASLFAGTVTNYDFTPGDLGYLVISSGAVKVNGVRATTGEGIVLREEATICVEALQHTELVFVITSPE